MAEAKVMALDEEEEEYLQEQDEGEELDLQNEVSEKQCSQQQQQHKPKMMAPALISIHPKSDCVVVSVGAGFRVFDLQSNEAVIPTDTTSPSGHRAAIRAARFDEDGGCFASAGDDKLVKLWDVHSWKCLKTILVNKKISALSFSKDGVWLFVADKFGVVYVIPTGEQEKREDISDEPAQLLAHCCSIITSLETSPCGKFVVTADRDFKIRVSVLPTKPEIGSYEIQSFCLGHTSFVSCLAFVIDGSSSQGLLVSGGGDATIRLWDYVAGSMLDVLEVASVLKIEGEASVLNLSTRSSTVAATIERFAGVLLLSCDIGTKKLSFVQKIMLQEQTCPTGLHFDDEVRLWLIAGGAETRDVGDRALTPERVAEMTAEAHSIAEAALARVQVVSKLDSQYEALEDDNVPGGNVMLKALQGSLSDSSISVAAAVAQAAEAAELAIRNLLSKRQYTEVQRERRKRSRNDKKASVPQ